MKWKLVTMSTLLWLLAMICQNTMGLILKEVSVPPFIVAGDKAVMGCNYDTQVFNQILKIWHLF